MCVCVCLRFHFPLEGTITSLYFMSVLFQLNILQPR